MASSRMIGIVGTLVVAATVGGLLERGSGNASLAASRTWATLDPAPRIPSGARIHVLLGHAIGAGTHVGDAWRGVLESDVALAGGGRLPAGSAVDGIVSAVPNRSQRTPRNLELRLIRVAAGGRVIPLRAASIGFLPPSQATSPAAVSTNVLHTALALKEGAEVMFRVR